MKTLSRRYFLHAAAISAVYVAGAKLGFTVAFLAEQVTLVWPPTGIALTTLLFFGYRFWPAIYVGAFLANVTTNEPVATALGIASGNTLEALCGAYLLKRAGFQPALSRLRDVLALALLGAAFSTMVSATIGVFSLCLGGVQPWDHFGSLWRLWWIGDAMGNLVMAPLLMVWVWAGAGRQTFKYELFLLVGLLFLANASIFGPLWPVANYPLEYLIFPFLAWGALRFGQAGTTLITFATAGLSIAGTVIGHGPFSQGDPTQNLLLLQMFIAVIAGSGLILGAAVSEREQALTTLERSHSLLRAITEGTDDAVFVKDLSGRYLMINSAGAAFLGKQVEEVVGQDDTRLFSPETALSIQAHDRSVVESGSIRTYEEIGTAAGVTRTYLSTKGPLRDGTGAITGLVGISRNISERKRIEKERSDLLAYEQNLRAEADEANRRKDEFLGMLAHELRNPLAALRNAIEVLKRSDTGAESAQWCLQILNRQTEHLARLVDDLIDVSRITHGKLELRLATLDIREVIRQAVFSTSFLRQTRRHEFSFELPPEPLWVAGDPVRLEQVLVNLLTNASKFTEPGGDIRIELSSREAQAVVRVKDNGRGIPADLIQSIFEPFAQGDQPLARSEGGLGIGLSLARGLAQLHHGTLTAFSSGAGQGSEFVLALPLMNQGPESPPVPSPLEPAHRTRRVLIAEDHRDAAETLSALLESSGHTCRVVFDGTEVTEAVWSFRPEVVLLDIGLPGLTGFQVASELRASGFKGLMIAVSGYGRESDRRASRQAGFDYHLLKPVDFDELENLLLTDPESGSRHAPGGA